MKKLIIVAMAIMLVFGAVGCQNSNPLTDPTNPMNPANPNSPLNPNNPNNQGNKFPVSEANDAVTNLIDGLDKAAIMQTITGKLSGQMTDMIKLGDYLTIKFVDDTPTRTYETTGAGLDKLEADLTASLEALMGAMTTAEAGKAMDFRKISSIEISATFNDYKGEFKTEVSDLETLNGTVDIRLVPMKMGIDGTNFEIVAPLYFSTSDLKATYTGDNDAYSFTIDDFMTLVEVKADLTDISGDEVGLNAVSFSLPEESNTQVISVTKSGVTRDVKWSDISGDLEDNTAFHNGSIDEVVKEAFYNHFGHLGFLHEIHAILASEETDETLKITSNAFTSEESTGTLTLGIEFANYQYYTAGSNQRVTGNVTIAFTGTYDSASSKFTATDFTVSSNGSLTLSDVADQIDDMSLTIANGTEGKMGTATIDNGIVFTVANNEASNLTYYYDTGDKHAEEHEAAEKATYDASKHSFDVDLFN